MVFNETLTQSSAMNCWSRVSCKVLNFLNFLMILLGVTTIKFCSKERVFKKVFVAQIFAVVCFIVSIMLWQLFNPNYFISWTYINFYTILIIVQPFGFMIALSAILVSNVVLSKKRALCLNKMLKFQDNFSELNQTKLLLYALVMAGIGIVVLCLIMIYFNIVFEMSGESYKVLRIIFTVFIYALAIYDAIAELLFLKALQQFFVELNETATIQHLTNSATFAPQAFFNLYFASTSILKKFFKHLAFHRILLIFIAKIFIVIQLYLNIALLLMYGSVYPVLLLYFVVVELLYLILIAVSATWGATLNEVRNQFLLPVA